jgi:hypothetical protein
MECILYDLFKFFYQINIMECIMCLKLITDDDLLQCKHHYHKNCIISCPLCINEQFDKNKILNCCDELITSTETKNNYNNKKINSRNSNNFHRK